MQKYSPPIDQAHGLRCLFAHHPPLFIPSVANPHVKLTGVLLEHLCSAFTQLGKNILLIDSSEHAPIPHELAEIDLSACIESLSEQLFYLAAKGLPLRYVDTHGSTASFLNALIEAAPQVEVMLIHASAADLVRLFGQTHARPLLMAEDRPNSITHAFSDIKLLSQRSNMRVLDLLLCIDPQSPRLRRIAQHLTTCSEDYFGVVLRQVIHLDPALTKQDELIDTLLNWAYLNLYARTADGTLGTSNILLPRHEPYIKFGQSSAYPEQAMN